MRSPLVWQTEFFSGLKFKSGAGYLFSWHFRAWWVIPYENVYFKVSVWMWLRSNVNSSDIALSQSNKTYKSENRFYIMFYYRLNTPVDIRTKLHFCSFNLEEHFNSTSENVFWFISPLFYQKVPRDQNLFFEGDLVKIAHPDKVTEMIQ